MIYSFGGEQPPTNMIHGITVEGGDSVSSYRGASMVGHTFYLLNNVSFGRKYFKLSFILGGNPSFLYSEKRNRKIASSFTGAINCEAEDSQMHAGKMELPNSSQIS